MAFTNDCDLTNAPANFSFASSINKPIELSTLYSQQKHFHMVQQLENIENLPESVKLCFRKMKETTSNLNIEVGAIIAFYEYTSPEIVLFSSQNQNSISKSEIDKALNTILLNSENQQIQKIVMVHTHPTDERIIPGHSDGDLIANKTIKDFLEDTLNREIKFESIVIPTYHEFNTYYVFGQLVINDRTKEVNIPIKSVNFSTR